MTSTGRRAIGLLSAAAAAVATQQLIVRACLDPWVALIGAVVVGTVAGIAARILLKKSQERRDAAAPKPK